MAKYRVSGIINVFVDAEDKREAISKANEITDRPVTWVSADEVRNSGDAKCNADGDMVKTQQV